MKFALHSQICIKQKEFCFPLSSSVPFPTLEEAILIATGQCAVKAETWLQLSDSTLPAHIGAKSKKHAEYGNEMRQVASWSAVEWAACLKGHFETAEMGHQPQPCDPEP